MKKSQELNEYVQTCFIINHPEASEINKIFRIARQTGAVAEEVLPYETESDRKQTSIIFGQTADQLNEYYQKHYNDEYSKEGGLVMGLEAELWEKRAKLALELGSRIVRFTLDATKNDLIEFESTMWAMRKSRKKS